MRQETKHRVTLRHNDPSYKDGNGTFDVTVTHEGDNRRYCWGHLGCSRTYYAETDRSAVEQFVREHACTVVRMRKR